MLASDPFRERLRANAPVRILSDSGQQDGTLLVIEGDRAIVELKEPHAAGALSEFLVDLGPTLGTARCQAIAGHELLTAGNEAPRQRFQIGAVAGADREAWVAWRSLLADGGNVTNFSGFSTAFSRDSASAPTPRETTSAALKKANSVRLLLASAPQVAEEDLVEIDATDGDED